ncbi:hypothetical protein K438DRAFT_1767257 [Mycena galopus ATCC 62051]|nr:hypothetical protein K438DRAFT_1767257 [Mycena galopus ATCC 62051]
MQWNPGDERDKSFSENQAIVYNVILFVVADFNTIIMPPMPECPMILHCLMEPSLSPFNPHNEAAPSYDSDPGGASTLVKEDMQEYEKETRKDKFCVRWEARKKEKKQGEVNGGRRENGGKWHQWSQLCLCIEILVGIRRTSQSTRSEGYSLFRRREGGVSKVTRSEVGGKDPGRTTGISVAGECGLAQTRREVQKENVEAAWTHFHAHTFEEPGHLRKGGQYLFIYIIWHQAEALEGFTGTSSVCKCFFRSLQEVSDARRLFGKPSPLVSVPLMEHLYTGASIPILACPSAKNCHKTVPHSLIEALDCTWMS